MHRSGQQVSGKNSDHFSTTVGKKLLKNFEATQLTLNKTYTAGVSGL